jgi:predicted amidophosphoribosyltransferase
VIASWGRLHTAVRAIGRGGSAAADPLLATVFPARCVCCGEFETFLCDACAQSLRRVGSERCPRCGHPGAWPDSPGWCPACVREEATFTSARSVFFHEGAAQRLATSFKYDGLRVLGRTMAELAAPDFRELIEAVGPAVVTWVPSHKANIRARGYNQAEVLARELARLSVGVETAPLASKVRRTAHQRGLGRQGRAWNLRGAFAAAPTVDGYGCGRGAGIARAAEHRTRASDALAERFGGVILVDDIYTTGATVAEVSRVLVGSLGMPVHVFTFGRTPSDLPQRTD